MAKRLRTTSALAVVVMMLVGACGEQHRDAVAGRIRAGRIRAGRIRAGRVRAGRIRQPRPRRRRSISRRSRPATPSWTRPSGADGKPFNGKKVSIQTQWTGGEGEGFAAAIKDFQAATGIAVQVDSIGSSHETVLKTRIEGGSPPDMAALAQPTARARVRRQGQGQGHRRDRGPRGRREAQG